MKNTIINKCLFIVSIMASTNVLALENSHRSISNIGFSEPKEIINITSRINGYIENWNFEKGDEINVSDVIVTIEDDKSNASIKSIRTEIDAAEKDLESKERLLTNNYASEIDVLNARSSLEVLKDSLERAIYLNENKKIESPINGVLRAKDIKEGESVSSGTILGQIYDPKSVDVYSNVYNFDKFCTNCKVIIVYDGEDYGPYEIDYKIKNLELGFDMTKVGVFLENSPIPYGVTLDFKIINERDL
jgi:multidrug efflux pump subunit AcrA (membrane-fusion protein)